MDGVFARIVRGYEGLNRGVGILYFFPVIHRSIPNYFIISVVISKPNNRSMLTHERFIKAQHHVTCIFLYTPHNYL